MAKTLRPSPLICEICGFNFGKGQIRSERHEPKTEEKEVNHRLHRFHR